MPSPLGVIDFFGQQLEYADLAVILVLVILEGVLSIDNALVLGLLAKRLPRKEQSLALWYGLVGAFVFRFIAVCTASFLLRWTIAKFLGGAYLVYIAVKHLFFDSKEGHETDIELDEYGHPKLVDSETGGPMSEADEENEVRERQPLYMNRESRKRLGLASFWPTVLMIELTDIAFAVDSILAAIAFVGAPPRGHDPANFHPKLWLVIVGGMLGVMLMRVAAQMFIKLLDRFPRFETSAYLLVIVIGLKLLADWGLNSDWSFDKPDWMAQRLGGWKQSFEGIETGRKKLAHNYDNWLQAHWPLPVPKQEEHKPEPGMPAHVPHLLDFHTLSRPESIFFWIAMIVCFCVGFIPKRKKSPHLPLGEMSE